MLLSAMLQKNTNPDAPESGAAPGEDAAAAAGMAAIAAAGRPRRRLWTYLALAVVLLAVVAAFWSWRSSHTASSAVTYITAPVTRGDLTVTVSATMWPGLRVPLNVRAASVAPPD